MHILQRTTVVILAFFIIAHNNFFHVHVKESRSKCSSNCC